MDSLRKKPTRRQLPPVRTPPHPVPSSHSSLATQTVPPKHTRRNFSWKVGAGILGVVFLSGLAILVVRGFQTASHIQIQNSGENAPASLREKFQSLRQTFLPGERTPLKGEERGRINVLLLGKADEDSPGKNLTDTLMLVSIDTEQRRVALLSLPRDLWVPIEGSSSFTKINTLYQYGLSQDNNFEPIKEAVTHVTDEPVDYVFMVDFKGFESVIDAIGGINVEVMKDFYDPRYPGKNYSYETFELKKGWQKLDGPTALKYARERHDDPEGDFGRAKRQQQILQAVKNKVSSPGTYLNFFKLYDLFLAFENNVKTDIAPEEMRSFYELSKTLDTQNITNVVYDAWKPESLLRVNHQILGGVRAFTLVPRIGTDNWSETRELAKHIFSLEALAERKKQIAEEEASLLIIHRGTDAEEASALALYLETEMGIEVTVRGPEILRAPSKQGILWTRVGTEKIYSLDEILKLLPVTKGEEATEPRLRIYSDADFILMMSDDLQSTFEHADELSSDVENQQIEEQSFQE